MQGTQPEVGFQSPPNSTDFPESDHARWQPTTMRRRKQDEELSNDSIEELKAQRNQQMASQVDEDEAVAAEGFELPGADSLE